MEKYIAICNGKKINVIDNISCRNINISSKILKYCYSALVSKMAIFFTSDDINLLEALKMYFSEKSILGFKGGLLFISLNTMEEKLDNMEDIYWIDTKEGISKGETEDCYVFSGYGTIVYINKGNQLVTVEINDRNDFKRFLPYLIRIIESLIIEGMLLIGYYPLHAALVSDGKNGILIMANSQGGKSTVAEAFYEYDKNFTLLSDDIVFMNIYGHAIPLGEYSKIMTKDIDVGCCEILGENEEKVFRHIRKINSNNDIVVNINRIIFPSIKYVSFNTIEEVQDKEKILRELLYEYPNQWFIFSEYNRLLANQIYITLSGIESYKITMAYGNDKNLLLSLKEELHAVYNK